MSTSIRAPQRPKCSITVGNVGSDAENTNMKIQNAAILRDVIPTPIFVVTTVRS
jgi:hypothetical protein